LGDVVAPGFEDDRCWGRCRAVHGLLLAVVGGRAGVVVPGRSCRGGRAGVVVPGWSCREGRAGVVVPVWSCREGRTGVVVPVVVCVSTCNGVVFKGLISRLR